MPVGYDNEEDDVQTTHLRTSMHKARKVHVCDVCGRDIAIGRRYQRDVLISDGVFCTFARCCTVTFDGVEMFIHDLPIRGEK